MSPIALALDGLLAGLLAMALVVGMRLNGRLKALRDSHAGFARSVTELDGAALRAETALAALRQAGEDTHDALLARIETARALSDRLEAQIGEVSAMQGRAARTTLPGPITPGRADARGPHRLESDDTLSSEGLVRRVPSSRARTLRPAAPEDELFETVGALSDPTARVEPLARAAPSEVVELIRRALGERR